MRCVACLLDSLHMPLCRLALLRFVFLVILSLSLPAIAQVTNGSLNGTVYDETMAVVPDAQVMLKDEATNVVRTTLSNRAGFFGFQAVHPGSYAVTITAQGFKTWELKNIVLNQAENRTLSAITLVLGSTKLTVEVTAIVSAAHVDTAESRTTLNSEMISNLAVQGRNASELIKIMPGMAMNRGLNNSVWDSLITSSNSGPVGQYSASGTQPNGSMTVTLDGASILDIGNMGTQVANINPEQTEEVTLLNSSFGAEFAKGPVTFQAISKSGTQQFHGEAYLFTRNGTFNANDAYLNSQNVKKPDESYYYSGFSLGGPVIIPGTRINKNHGKLFFFTAYEYMKQQPAGQLYQSIVPTAAMLAGDFSSAQVGRFAGDTSRVPCDPSLSGNWWYGSFCGSTNNFITNGIIPAAKLDPDAVALAKLLPPPNQNPSQHSGYNYSTLVSTPVDRWEYKLKMDYNITQSTRLSGSYTRQSEGNANEFGVWFWPGGTMPYPSPLVATINSRTISANLWHTFSPTMTNEVVFAYSFFTFPPKFANASAVDPANVTGYTNNKIWQANILPQIPNIVSWSCNWISSNGCFPALFAPSMQKAFNGGGFGNRKSIPSIADNFSNVFGSHTTKAGFYFEMAAHAQTTGHFPFWGQGMYVFDYWTGNSTGNYLADFLIGHGQYTQTQEVPVEDVRYKTVSFYGSDQWKATRRLTLTYGVRIDHLGQWYPAGDHPGLAVWDPSTYNNSPSAPPHSGMTWHAVDKSTPISGWGSKFSIAPRVGVAYDLFGNGKTVLRGGFGVYPWRVSMNDISQTYLVPLGYRTVTTGALSHLADVANYTPGALGSFNGDSNYALKKGDDKVPYTQTWNFIISQQLPGRSVLELQYTGNRTRDALLTGLSSAQGYNQNINKIPLGALWALKDPVTGEACRQLNPDGTCSADTWTSWNGLPDISGDFRPYLNYGKALIPVTHGSYSNYNAMMVTWQKSKGMAVYILNYTFSKVLGIRDGQMTNNINGNGSVVDPYNLKNNYGVLAYDHTHIFNAAYTFFLPKLIHEGNPFARGAVNDWVIAGITQLQSGAPLQPNTGGNLNASMPVSTFQILGTDDSAVLMPYLTCDPSKGLTSGQYFNPSCFAVPNTVGVNGPYNWPYVRGPAYFNSDLSVYKNFKITERHNIQFRFSAFNFLNHPLKQFGLTDDATMRFQAVPGQDSSLHWNQLQYEQFNTLFTGKPAFEVGRRVIEFGLKYSF